jgi:hypothetical protein
MYQTFPRSQALHSRLRNTILYNIHNNCVNKYHYLCFTDKETEILEFSQLIHDTQLSTKLGIMFSQLQYNFRCDKLG